MQESYRCGRFSHFFGGYFVKRKSFFAIRTHCFLLIGDNQQAPTLRAWSGQGTLPGCKVTLRVVGATVENATLASFPLDDLSTIFGALDPDLLKPGFGVPAFGEIAATDKFAITTPPDDQFVATLWALATNWLRSHVHFGYALFG